MGRGLNFYSNSVIRDENYSHNPRSSATKIARSSLRRTSTLKNQSLPSMMMQAEEEDTDDDEEEK